MSDHPARDDRLAEAVACVRRMPVPDPPPAELVLGQLHRSETVTVRSIPRAVYESIRQMHPVFHYGLVAAILALVLIGLGTHSKAIQLADVAETIARHKTVRFEQEVGTPQEVETPFGREHRLSRATTVFGTLDRVHARMERPGRQVQILDRAKGTILHLDPQRKSAQLVKFPGGNDQVGFLAIIEQLEKDRATTSARERLDGLEVVVYRLTKDRVRSTIWVDLKTKLPVRMEMEMVGQEKTAEKAPGRPNRKPSGKGETENARVKAEKIVAIRQKTTLMHFVWDPPIESPDRFFSVEPPPGYEVKTRDLFTRQPGE